MLNRFKLCLQAGYVEPRGWGRGYNILMLDLKQLGDLSEYYSQEIFCPRVVVVSSPAIKARMASLHLCPSSFLGPFFDSAKGAAYKELSEAVTVFKSVSGERSVTNFSLSPVALEDYSLPSFEDTQQQINQVLAQKQPQIDHISQSLFTNREQVEAHLKEHHTEWYDHAVKSLYRLGRNNLDASLLDEPLALIYLLDYQDDMQVLQQLQQDSQQPLSQVFRQNPQGHLNIPRANLVLFDNDQDFAIATSFFESICQQFPSSFNKIFGIGSPESSSQSLWPQGSSVSMSKADVTLLYNTCMDITCKVVLSIETKIQLLDQNIQINKKGFKNYMKNFLKGKEKSKDPNNYLLNPQELQHLQLASLLLLIGDYYEALTYLTWLQEELKEKSHRHYVHLLETSSICQLLLLHTKTQNKINETKMMAIGESFETAFKIAKNLPYLKRQVYRCLANVLAYQRIFFRYTKNTAQNTFNMLQDTKDAVPDLSAEVQCLFKEQQALMYLRIHPVNFRKYCMHQIYTGHKYLSCKLYAHSIRCYMVALVFHQQSNWKPINDYLFTHLAQGHRQLKRYPQALSYYKQALNLCDKYDSQQKHIKFAQDIQALLLEMQREQQSEQIEKIDSGEEALQLPVLCLRQIDVVLQKDAIWVDNQERYFDYVRPSCTPLLRAAPLVARPGKNQAIWTALYKQIHQQMVAKAVKDTRGYLIAKQEGELVGLFDSLNLFQKNQIFKRAPRVSYVGHTLRLLFFMSNPLKIPLEVKDISPIYLFQGDSDAQHIEYSPLDLTIRQLESDVQVQLAIKLLQPGTLTLQGLRWQVLGLDCSMHFPFSEQNKKNVITVQEKQGFLQIGVTGLDNQVFCHQIKQLDITLHNANKDNCIKHVFIQSSSDRLVFQEIPQRIEADSQVSLVGFLRGGSEEGKENLSLLVKTIDVDGNHYLQRLMLPISTQKSVCLDSLQCFQNTSNYMFTFQVQTLLDNHAVQINKIVLLNRQFRFSDGQALRLLHRQDNLHFWVHFHADDLSSPSLRDQVPSALHSLENPEVGPSPLEDHLPLLEQLLSKAGETAQPSDLQFLLFWQWQESSGQLVRGILDGLRVDICGVSAQNKECPLSIDLLSPATHFSHCFQEEGVCRVDMQVVIKNTRSLSPLSFLFEMANQEEQQYFLQGQTRHNVVDLPFNTSLTAPLSFLFLQSGFYNVSKFLVTLRLGQGKQLSFSSEELQHVKHICIQ